MGNKSCATSRQSMRSSPLSSTPAPSWVCELEGEFFLPDFPAKKFITSGCAECPVLYSCDALVLVVREDAADGDRHVLHHSPPPLVRRICQGVSKYELKKAFFN